MDFEKAVLEFMEKHAQFIGDDPYLPPPMAVTILRMRLMGEELGETLAAMHEGDPVKIADGLADLIYVAVGTAIAYGIPINEVFAEVHASNMTKPRLDRFNKGGKVSKGDETFRPPDIKRLLDNFKDFIDASPEQDEPRLF